MFREMVEYMESHLQREIRYPMTSLQIAYLLIALSYLTAVVALGMSH